jgi:RNase P/RNase MRP subunit p29
MHRMILAILLTVCVGIIGAPVRAQNVVDFPGTVLKVDTASGKLTVKKDGARFTFVVDGRTQYAGIKALKDIKAGDAVTVTYITMGSQYIAQKIAKK